jgi:hypothetical protein
MSDSSVICSAFPPEQSRNLQLSWYETIDRVRSTQVQRNAKVRVWYGYKLFQPELSRWVQGVVTTWHSIEVKVLTVKRDRDSKWVQS